MSRFTEILNVSPLPDGKNWVIMKDFGYYVGEEDSGNRIDVPIGFITDFASVPRVLWWFIPKWGKYGNATVIHDYLYWDQHCCRKKADNIFRDGMVVLQVQNIRIFFLYWAVKLFGCMAWRKNRRMRNRGFKKVLKPLPAKVADWNRIKIYYMHKH